MAVNAYIPLDIMKPTPTTIDLSGNFNGRVGDAQSYIKIWFKTNGLPLDLTNLTPYFEGKDSNGTPFAIYGTAKADQTGDNLQTGRVSFYFPAGTFQVEGQWDNTTTFFGIKDSAGTIISTVNVTLTVLANSVEMGIDKTPFFTALQTIIDEMNEFVAAQEAKIKATEDDVLNDDSTLNKTLAAVKAQVSAYQAVIDAGKAITQADLDKANTELGTGLKEYVDQAVAKLVVIEDYRTAYTPQQYYDKYPSQSVTEIKANDTLGVGLKNGDWGYLTTETPTESATLTVNGMCIQTYKIATDSGNGTVAVYIRTSKSPTEWNDWYQVTLW